MRAILSRFILVLLLVFSAVPCFPDAFVVSKAMKADTIAEIFIEDDVVRLELEIGLKDIPAFKNILPDDIYERLGNKPSAFRERLEEFLREDFVFTADGKRLEGRIISIEPQNRILRDEITGEPLPVSEEEKELVVFAVFEYKLEGKPTEVSIKPPFDENGYPVGSIGFVTYHEGIPLNNFLYLGREEKLTLDWEDPWYSQFERRQLRRRYNAPISAFIYVEPFEVRKEIIVRPKDLQHWIDLSLENENVIKADEREEVKKKAAEFFLNRDPVLIDGKKKAPILDRVNFIRRSLKTTTVIEPGADIPLSSACLGIIYVYPTTGLPQEVTMEWQTYNPRIQKINSSSVDEAGGFPYFLTPDDTILVWKNFLKNPTIPSLVDLAPPDDVMKSAGWRMRLRNLFSSTKKIPEKDVEAILTGLLRNIYHAFDFREESDSYDILANSASGDLLTQIYLETRRSLTLKAQGGAKVKIKEIELKKVVPEFLKGEVGFKANCVWNVSGSVGHWGHIHQRKNQYEAILTVKAVDGEWKITDLEMLNEKRL